MTNAKETRINDPKSKSSFTQSEELADDTVYDSPFKPLMWLLIPFILVLIYGAFSA